MDVVEGVIGKDSVGTVAGINCFFVSGFFGATGIHSFSAINKKF